MVLFFLSLITPGPDSPSNMHLSEGKFRFGGHDALLAHFPGDRGWQTIKGEKQEIWNERLRHRVDGWQMGWTHLLVAKGKDIPVVILHTTATSEPSESHKFSP